MGLPYSSFHSDNYGIFTGLYLQSMSDLHEYSLHSITTQPCRTMYLGYSIHQTLLRTALPCPMVTAISQNQMSWKACCIISDLLLSRNHTMDSLCSTFIQPCRIRKKANPSINYLFNFEGLHAYLVKTITKIKSLITSDQSSLTTPKLSCFI